ncbi:MAG: PQQ-binding-like beta-propeller repeat protein, partial [Phycisphaerae bacterium]
MLKMAGALAVMVLLAGIAWATETENLGIRVLPAPGKVVVDGQVNDWDLSGGVFCCGDVENAREKMAAWFHLMYDQDNLYVLTRWTDPTPLNNPGVTSGDFGFHGDSLQFRFITAPGTPDEKCTHVTAWQGRDGKDLIDLAYGRKFDQGNVRDAKAQGGQQAFAINEDKKGYVQEIALPWKLLSKSGAAPKAGDTVTVTLEPNFTIGARGRITIKDIFKPGVTLDRVFTFMAAQVWGPGTIEAKGQVEPKPVRLSDGREFAVRLVKGLPDVDWTGIVKSRELQGFKPIAVTLAEDGYVSVVIKDAGGTVVRELLTATFMTKGTHEVKWDALGTPNWRTPGEPVAPGAYTWSAIYHTGIGLRLKGWACNSGITPWDYPAGKGNWGGDHGIPVACAADESKVYLGWSGAEAGKALLACDLDGKVQWNNTHGGIAGASLVAVDGDTVYALNESTLYRVEKKGGTYTPWAGSDSTDLKIEKPNALAAAGGKLYLSYTGKNAVSVLDGASGKPVKQFSVHAPGGLAVSQDRLLVISGGSSVVAVDLQSGQSKPAAGGFQNAACIAVDKGGKIYVGGPDNQV